MTDRTNVLIGVEYGQQNENSAICVAEERREVQSKTEQTVPVYRVRHLERLPVGATMPALADRLDQVVRSAREQHAVGYLAVFVNATGGSPLLDCLGMPTRERLRAVYFNHGAKRDREGSTMTMGKAYLVTRLQMRLQTARVKLPDTAEARLLAQELLAYELHVSEDPESRKGAFSVDARDDFVMALGLAVQDDHSIGTLQMF